MKFSELQDKFELYIISLWLLFLLIIVVTVDIPICIGKDCVFIGFSKVINDNVIPIISLLFVMLGIIFYIRFNYKISGSKRLPSEITEIEDLNYEHLTFLTTYIIPLICFNLTSTRYILALSILLVVIGIIYVKTDKFYANPTLAILGFRLYKVNLKTRTGTNDRVVVITTDRLFKSDLIRILDLDEKVCFARKVK